MFNMVIFPIEPILLSKILWREKSEDHFHQLWFYQNEVLNQKSIKASLLKSGATMYINYVRR